MWFPTFLLVVSALASMCYAGSIPTHEPQNTGNSKHKNYDDPYMTGTVTDCPPNVMFLLDGSDSVSPTAFQIAKTALVREIRAVTQTFVNTNVGVVMFSGLTQTIDIMARTQQEIENLIFQVESLQQPRMKTSLPTALRQAREMLVRYSVKQFRAYDGDKAGGVIVLFSDGQTENPVATVEEAKMAKDKNIPILSMTIDNNPQMLLLQHISHLVQDCNTPIDWTSYVACPAFTLEPVTRLSECRDFVMVVDGSDSVLTHKATVRQYMAYTALRYRWVRNAIGFNVYGTDPTVQHADTRIRPEDDKYDLAHKIRTMLMFPKSGGTGTDTAVTQSVGMLEDDLRDTSKGLVLITDGSPPDPQAARQAIQAARDRGYPVIIIRVGDHMTDAELNTLAGGDQTNVFSVATFTDLFSVNFDSILCGQNPVCSNVCPINAQLTSTCSCSCINTYQQYNNVISQCVCPQNCPSNAQQDATCGCICNDPLQRYNRTTNTCEVTDRVCPSCPSNASTIPFSCNCQCDDPRLVYNSLLNQCQCPQNCPVSARQTGVCDCICSNPNQFYNRITNQCECTQSCPTTSVQDFNCQCVPRCSDPTQQYNSQSGQCECIQNCPSDAVLTGVCGCSCTNSLKQYDTVNRQCVCRQSCSPDSTQDPNCQCVSRCPNPAQRFNSLTGQCECIQSCPSNAVQTGVCGCTCTNANQQYDSSTGTCVCIQSCPAGSVPNANCQCTPRCTNPNQRFNIQTGLCECIQSCPSNAVQTSVCGCTCTNANQQYDSSTGTCVCIQSCPAGSVPNANCQCTPRCTNPNQRFNIQTGLCECIQSCPSNAVQTSVCGCTCTNANQQYDSSTGTCVCIQSCPAGSVPNANCQCTPRCTNPDQRFNIQTGLCECIQNCPNGAFPTGVCGCGCYNANQQYNSVTNQCECSQNCPSGAYLTTDCNCICTNTNLQYNSATGQCECSRTCPSGSYVSADCNCICTNTNLQYSIATNRCECTRTCPSGSYLTADCNCLCTNTNLQYNSATDRCECTRTCPSGSYLTADCNCLCTNTNLQYNSATDRCECSRTCPSGSYLTADCNCLCTNTNLQYNIATNRCECSRTCPSGSYLTADCNCLCTNTNLQYNSATNRCECSRTCPSGSYLTADCNCLCTNTNLQYNSATNRCECTRTCPSGSYVSADCNCICTNTNQQYNIATNRCECARNCPNTAIPVGNCQCSCIDPSLQYNSTTNQCECPQACPTGAVRTSGCGCNCPGLLVYNSATNRCVDDRQGPFCPSNAFPVGGTCQCTEQNLIYNPVLQTCQCPQDCPSGAIPTSGCDCVCPAPLVYNSFANQCECQLTCPFGAQLSSSCNCVCTNQFQVFDQQSRQCVTQCPLPCPANSLQNTFDCGCTCNDPGRRYDAQTNQCECRQNCPSGAFQTGDCTCVCYDQNGLTYQCGTSPTTCPSIAVPLPGNTCQCPNGYVYNSVTNQCDIQSTTTPNICPASEYSCENGQVAYRDCSGRCSCVCEQGFAGPRCEITVNADICDGCYYFNGVYHAGVNGFCDLYVHCIPIRAPGEDPAIRPTAFKPYIMSCAPGTFYITRPDGWQGCDFLDNGHCSSDQCSLLQPNATYADASACQRYWQCGLGQRLTSRACCPAGQSYNSNFRSCVPDSTCQDTCGLSQSNACSNGNNNVERCPFDVNPSDPNEYFYRSVPWAPSRCAPTDIMNLTVCGCVPALPSRSLNCLPTVSYDFEDSSPHSEEDNVPRRDLAFLGLVGDFEGNDDLIFKAFADSGFYTDHFQINLRLFLPQPFSGGQRMAVVTNADCEQQESVSVTMDGQNFYFRVFPMGSNEAAEIVIPYSGRADANGWYDIQLVYRRVSSAEFVFSGTVGSSTSVYNGFVPLTSYIDSRKCALHVGYGYNYAGLIGYVDDITIWRCDPATATGTFQG